MNDAEKIEKVVALIRDPHSWALDCQECAIGKDILYILTDGSM